uniref:Integrase, catalytic region, zinc finger, CCHC-type, peptidase aspartic, catalytic n=1 Tax=Tanacetum cinerariifolium TaxID=118510 RepID=A0A6L2MSW1_TANCI|nr:hypothetical protein [Tanacetum cinerariifolium]
MSNLKKSVAERTHHQRQYDRRVNKRQMQTHESKIDTGKVVDAGLVVTKINGTELEVQDNSRMSGNDIDADDEDIRPIYNEEPMTEEKAFVIAALKNNLRKLKGNNVDTKFAKISVLGKPVLQSLRNQSVVRQPNAFKSKRPQMSKPRFTSQLDVNNNLSRPVTQHYLLKKRESAFAKPDHMIASSESRDSSMNMPRFSSNDMVHNHYLDEDRKKIQERDRNSKTSEVNSRAKIQSHKTRNNNKPVDQKSHTQIPCRQIFTGHRFSPNKTSAVYEKTSPRSDLRWKPTGRIFKSIGLRWIPIGKLFDSCTSKVENEPTHDSNVDIPNIYESKQTLDSSAEVPTADMISMKTMIELESLFGPSFDEYFNEENQVVSKPSAVTTVDTSDKR